MHKPLLDPFCLFLYGPNPFISNETTHLTDPHTSFQPLLSLLSNTIHTRAWEFVCDTSETRACIITLLASCCTIRALRKSSSERLQLLDIVILNRTAILTWCRFLCVAFGGCISLEGKSFDTAYTTSYQNQSDTKWKHGDHTRRQHRSRRIFSRIVRYQLPQL